MEVKSFLNAVYDMAISLSHSLRERDNAQCNSIRAGWCDRVSYLTELYSQSFDKSLIPNLFKYWNKSEFNNDYVNVSDNCIYFMHDAYSIREDKNRPETGVMFLRLPKTLDDFINDCHRVGIELYWREEIIKQYFK